MGNKHSSSPAAVVEDGSEMNLIIQTDIEVLSSQGMHVSRDSSVAMSHASTSPPNYYRSKYGIDGGINMDRGGFGRHIDGTNFGCIYDGVTSGGKRNAYAAQAFASFTLRQLAMHKMALVAGIAGSQEAPLPLGVARPAPATALFNEAVDALNNPGQRDPRWEAEGGAATGAFAAFADDVRETPPSSSLPPQQPIEADGAIGTPGALMVVGAALGDAAVIVLDLSAGTARQINAVERAGGSAADSGGQLNMCMGLSGRTQAFAERIPNDGTMILLATDGLTDNLPVDALRNLEPEPEPEPGREHTREEALPPCGMLVALVLCPLLDNAVPGGGLPGQGTPPPGTALELLAELGTACGHDPQVPLPSNPWPTVSCELAAVSSIQPSKV